MKLWSGRFEGNTDKLTDDFNSSISFDQRLYKQDINGSIAHVTMLAAQGIIPAGDKDKIIEGLTSILNEIEEGKVEFSIDAEDIHMNIESLLIKKIGNTGKKLHTGRSRNDQVALDLRMYVKEEVKDIQNDIHSLIKVLLELAEKNLETIMPGYTHLQRAQPITFAHHLMAYVEMFKRDSIRMDQVYTMANSIPLGAGALATTTYPIDRELTKELLNFDSVMLNSLDAVSDRDYCLDLLSAISIAFMHLSRFSEEIILWCSSEFGFITLDDAFSTGSSIMPQKKNPDIAELVRGKTGRVYGDLLGLLTVLKGIPLAYNKDMQEDKEAVFDAIDTIKMALPTFTKMVSTMTINKDNMRRAANGGFTNATDAADWLVKQGVAFRDAHEIIGKLVFYCLDKNIGLDELSLNEYKEISEYFTEDIYDAISLETCVNDRNVIGGPAIKQVSQAIAISYDWLNNK